MNILQINRLKQGSLLSFEGEIDRAIVVYIDVEKQKIKLLMLPSSKNENGDLGLPMYLKIVDVEELLCLKWCMASNSDPSTWRLLHTIKYNSNMIRISASQVDRSYLPYVN